MIPTPSLDAFRDTLPDELKDLRLNLSAVLGGENLSSQQAMLVALTSARFLHSQPLVEAVESDIRSGFSPVESIAIISDSIACAGLMAMNTIYYRFRHMIEKESYQSRPARLRMSRMAPPTTSTIALQLRSRKLRDVSIQSNGCAARYRNLNIEYFQTLLYIIIRF